MKSYGLFLNGVYVQTPDHFEVNNPTGLGTRLQLAMLTERYVDSLPLSADENPLEAALEGARLTFEQILAGNLFRDQERLAFLDRFYTRIEDQKENLARLMHQEVDKALELARLEIDRGLAMLARARDASVTSMASLPCGGPVLALTSSDDPVSDVLKELAPAFVAGCPVLLHPAKEAGLTALTLADFAHACELPAGMLSVLQCDPAITERLKRDRRIAKIS